MAKTSKKVESKVKYRTLRAISFIGERVETGTVLELSVDDLKKLNMDYLERVDSKKEQVKEEEQAKVEEEKKEGTEIEI